MKLSAVLQISVPLPFTVNVLVEALKLALPANPTAPISLSLHPLGRPVGTLTVRLTVAECERLPLVPVMVNVYVPAGVDDEVATLSVDEPEPVTDAGLKDPVAPVGNPLTLRLTALLKPFCALTLAV